MLNFCGSKSEGSVTGSSMFMGSVDLKEVLEGHDEKAEIGTTNSKF